MAFSTIGGLPPFQKVKGITGGDLLCICASLIQMSRVSFLGCKLLGFCRMQELRGPSTGGVVVWCGGGGGVGLSSASGVTTAAAPCAQYRHPAPPNHWNRPSNKLREAGACKKCGRCGPGQNRERESPSGSGGEEGQRRLEGIWAGRKGR